MTAVQQPPMTGGDAALHWDVNNMAGSDLEDLEDDESNSAKLFERSRIRALAGMFSVSESALHVQRQWLSEPCNISCSVVV